MSDEIKQRAITTIEAKISRAFPGTYYGTTFDCAEAILRGLLDDGLTIVPLDRPRWTWDDVDNAINQLVTANQEQQP